MTEEYVTKIEFERVLSGLEMKVATGFANVEQQLNKIMSQIEIGKHTDREAYDDRYVLREEAMQEAISRVSNPAFRAACYPIVGEYNNTEDGKRQLGCIIDQHLAAKRDGIVGWINFFKLIGGIIIVGATLYGGSTIVESNKTTQQAVLKVLEVKGE